MGEKVRRRVTLVIHDGGDRVLVGRHKKTPKGLKAIAFPGGGVEEGQSVDRAAGLEAKEEIGVRIKNLRPVGVAPRNVPLPNGGKDYKDGQYSHIRQYWRVGQYAGEDKSLLGSEGDALRNRRFVPISEATKTLEETAMSPKNPSGDFDRQQAAVLRRIQKTLKTAADEDPLQLIRKFGPPTQWSGAVASRLGPERRRVIFRAWRSLSSEERKTITEKFKREMQVELAGLREKRASWEGAAIGGLAGSVVRPARYDLTGGLIEKGHFVVKGHGKSAAAPLTDRLLSLFSKEKRRAIKRTDQLHRSDDPAKWNEFMQHVGRKSYAKQLSRDSRSDDKLIRHADSMNRLLTGKTLDTVRGDTGEYDIIRLRGGGLGCTCPDWRYKRSVAAKGTTDCKHIRAWKADKKVLEKQASALRSRVSVVRHSPTEYLDGPRAAVGVGAGVAAAKVATIHILTGGTGAGKSTRAKALADRYDLVLGTDLGGVVGGRFVMPAKEDRPRLHAEKQQRIMQAHNEGQKILLEGYSRGILKYPEVMDAAEKLEVLDVPFPVRMYRIAKRSFERDGSLLQDMQMGVKTHRPLKRELAQIRERMAGREGDLEKGAMSAGEAAAPRGAGPLPGDLVLVSTGAPDKKQGGVARLVSEGYSRVSPLLQGTFTHSAIVGPRGAVIEAMAGSSGAPGSVRKVSFRKATRGRDYVLVRPKASAAARRGAARFAGQQVGAGYDTAGTGAAAGSLVLPRAARRLNRRLRGNKTGKQDAYQCASLIASAYERQGVDLVPSTRHSSAAPAQLISEHPMKVLKLRVRRGTKLRTALNSGISDGQRDVLKLGMSPQDADHQGLQRGDVILTAMAPEQYSKDTGAPLHKRMKEGFFRWASPAAQGGYTHSAIYVGKGRVVESLQGGTVKRTLKRALQDLDGAVVVRPKVSARSRRAAAAFAEKQVGAPYESHKFLAGKGSSLFLPKYFDRKFDHGKKLEDTKEWTCSNLIGAAYASQGHATHTRGGRWSMTAPADFLVSERNDHVKHLGKALKLRPRFGRLKGKADLADVSEATVAKEAAIHVITGGIGDRGGLLEKSAATLKSTPQEHQKRVLRKLRKVDGVIVAHRVGGGKTLTSIAAGVETGLPIQAIVPAPLVANYKKEVEKHVEGPLQWSARSYAKATRDAEAGIPAVDPESLLVLDEAHRLRNTGTKQHTHLAIPARGAKKRLLLTGTAVYNNPADLAVLTNIARGEAVLPENPTEFRKKFIQESEVNPGFLKRMIGIQPGVRRSLKNQEELLSALEGHVDLYDGDSADFPRRIDESIAVPMSKTQTRTYDYLMDRAPLGVRLKIKAGLPPSKAESRSLNAFISGARQASLSPRPYITGMTDAQEAENTPKIQEAVKRLRLQREQDPNFRGVVYSNYIDAGLNPYSKALAREGIPHLKFTGGLTKKKKDAIVRSYNEGQTPVLLVSSSGTEGLDLKGTKLVQVMEPHWNNSKIEQVVGRGIRYKSHAHLPDAEREVRVQRYFSSMPQGRLSKFLGRKPGKSTEQWLQDRSDAKDVLASQIRDVMQKAHEKAAGTQTGCAK